MRIAKKISKLGTKPSIYSTKARKSMQEELEKHLKEIENQEMFETNIREEKRLQGEMHKTH